MFFSLNYFCKIILLLYCTQSCCNAVPIGESSAGDASPPQLPNRPHSVSTAPPRPLRRSFSSLVLHRFADMETRLVRIETEIDKLIRQQLHSPRSPHMGSPISGLVRRPHVGGRNAKSPMSTGHRSFRYGEDTSEVQEDYFSVLPGYNYNENEDSHPQFRLQFPEKSSKKT